ncbi:MAG TPA: metallophosphoesterase family protein [Chloroflexota bacterium]|nr:metallophosphoesterase family protein [Chloroflexota bacterium]
MRDPHPPLEAPAGPYTYAVGDLHGEVTLLRRMLDTLPIRDQDTLVFLGDYVDGGEDSAATIATLRALEQRRPVVFLRGNHEDAWLDRWTGTDFMPGPPEIGGARKTWRDFGGRPSSEIGHWMARTRIDFEDQYAFYVHAGVLPGRPFDATPPLQKLYGAGSFLETEYQWEKPVVFGHWEVPEPLLRPNKIGINTHAHHSGVLTAIRLPDRAIFQVRR